jgi:lipoprotein-releasing system permease protein
MHAINIISGISMAGVLIGSAALVIILSVFNGFEVTILNLNGNFSPEIKIEPRLGKTFDPNTPYFASLQGDPRVFSFTPVLQEKALIKYDNKSFIGTIKGVGRDFLKNPLLDSTIQNGSFMLKSNNEQFAVLGAEVENNLSVNVKDRFSTIDIYAPRRQTGNESDPLDEFVVRPITPSGVFEVGPDFDDIVVTTIDFTRELLDQPKNVSSLEINYKKGTDLDAVQAVIKDKIGKNFTVKNRREQNTELYKTLNYERWFIFMILTFVLIIAIFNIIGSLTMLVIDKRKDIAILTSLGANKRLIQGIFFIEGMMITITGCITGIILGLGFCILQQRFGLVKMGSKMSMIDAYPVSLRLGDFVLVFFTVSVIAVIASGISARLSIKGLTDIKQDL